MRTTLATALLLLTFPAFAAPANWTLATDAQKGDVQAALREYLASHSSLRPETALVFDADARQMNVGNRTDVCALVAGSKTVGGKVEVLRVYAQLRPGSTQINAVDTAPMRYCADSRLNAATVAPPKRAK